jgi:hypothetical protein
VWISPLSLSLILSLLSGSLSLYAPGQATKPNAYVEDPAPAQVGGESPSASAGLMAPATVPDGQRRSRKLPASPATSATATATGAPPIPPPPAAEPQESATTTPPIPQESAAAAAAPVATSLADSLHSDLRVCNLTKGSDGFQFVIKGAGPVVISNVDVGGVAEEAQLLGMCSVVCVEGTFDTGIPRQKYSPSFLPFPLHPGGDVIVKFNGAEVASFNKDEVLITPLPLPHISYVVCAEVTFDIVIPKEKRLPPPSFSSKDRQADHRSRQHHHQASRQEYSG